MLPGYVMACELFAAKYRTFAGTIAGDFWAVATCLSALLAYLVQNWVHFQLIISLFGLLSIPLYWYYNFTSLMYYILLTLSILTIKIKSIAFLPARRYARAVLAVIVCLSICPSVRPSRLSVTSRCSRRTKTCAKYQNPWRHIHKWLFRYTLCSTFRHLYCPDLVCPKILRVHGLCRMAIQAVFRSVILARLLYASLAWWGCAGAQDRQCL